MAEIIKRSKALAVNPLKVSQPVGASLAFLGIHRAIPMMHGSQGCTAFAKVFFVRHFREPIPLQTTAMDQGSTVMGADENVIVGLKTIAEKNAPALIGLPTTGLSETEGTDIQRLVKEFRSQYPEYDGIPVVPVNTPDFTGCLESGFALAVKAIVEYVVPADTSRVGKRKKQVNVLAGAHLTPGDLEHVLDLVEAFGLRAVLLPDVSGSLDGHLTDADFSPLTVGGTTVSDIEAMGESVATLVLGHALCPAADLLKERTGVPDWRFASLMGLDNVDAFVAALAEISGQPVPEKIERQRAQLQDAMVDTHFMLGFARVAIAADPDLLYGLADLVAGMGCEVTAAVAPSKSAILEAVPTAEVKLGDLQDLEKSIKEHGADLILCNSHAAETAQRLGLPLIRAGFPQYDLMGGYQKQWVGYRGTRQTLFDLANTLVEHGHHEIEPYRSIYAEPAEEGHAAPETRPLH
ncbi:nitrogenase iron-molybdenum cofactor biosynthesis protein NifN [Parasulfuritortus cantonensis]|uniref:Nitrogenase iron-molybdenum cofactor biosynthesis protein NifN n=1 Tax=Parasulfuritortus cantonensis TaxID=2528202 RepID=A0A4R1B5B5_9PROT|nr:nitrogenase iron-molybdenum cofactor biosynthesis protein NifN [Parasulfuritortus cantonensis]TCJ11677.1 nitrogenase iron-molybdenum cofactor biosynthesis protein NifN [Parasulfuritortus cantonensis]